MLSAKYLKSNRMTILRIWKRTSENFYFFDNVGSLNAHIMEKKLEKLRHVPLNRISQTYVI